jgi:hypothetical protein
MRTLLYLFLAAILSAQNAPKEDYLNWSMQQASTNAQSTYQDGKVGSRNLLVWTGVDTRWLKTERAQNYKVRATWFTPEVIEGTARFAQLQSRLRDDEVRKLVAEAEQAGDTVVMVEIDPNQGSGVIPPDWEAFLQPTGATKPEQAVRGKEQSDLRKVRALQGVRQRNYDYDRFWVVFPLVSDDGEPTIAPDTREIDLIVRIYNREGHVHWIVPDSIRSRILKLSEAQKSRKPPKS